MTAPLRALPDGVVTPLVTLLDDTGAIDATAMTTLVDAQVASGIDGVLAGGSTGELGTLGAPARLRAAEVVVEASAGRVPVWAGVAGLSTDDAVAEAVELKARGVDALLALPAMYFTHSDDELVTHFSRLREVGLPLVAYDVPARTPQKLSNALMVRLAESGTIDGVKDSSGNMSGARVLRALLPDSTAFRCYYGVEFTVEGAVAGDADGIVPGFANFAPLVFSELWAAAREGKRERARALTDWVCATAPILEAPWPGGGGLAIAIGALKEATAWALGLPHPQRLGTPFGATAPEGFRTRVVDILEAAMATGTVDRVAVR